VRPVLHAATHALFDACLAPGAAPPPAWLIEGLAERLSSCGVRPGSEQPVVCAPDVEALRALLRAFNDRSMRVAALHTLPGLLEVTSLADLEALSTDTRVPLPEVLAGFGHETSLFLAWLDESVHLKPDRASASRARCWPASPARRRWRPRSKAPRPRRRRRTSPSGSGAG
jgi:hypothetical protein